MSLIQRRRIGDALAALLRREGVHQEMGGADEAGLHGRCRLNGHERVHQVLIDTTTELGQGFGSYKRGLGGICLDFGQTTGVHDCDIRTQALTDIFIGRTALVLEEFQGQQHPE